MPEQKQNVLDAAVRTFSRYGVKRTSMADLAKEAGISRQTLYNVYQNKDEVLRALIRHYADTALEEIEAGLKEVEDLGDQLDVVFAKMSVAGFDMVETTPNAQDLIEGFNASGQDEIEAATERFRAVIEKILRPHQKTLASSRVTLAELSDFVQRSAKAASKTARDRDHLLTQLKTLKQLCLSAAGISDSSR